MKSKFHSEQKLPIKIKNEKVNISIKSLKQGINMFNDFFIYKDNIGLKVYDRKCDHANGKLVRKKNKMVCPLHEWCFDPKKGMYKNLAIKKEPIEHKINDKGEILIATSERKPSLPNLGDSKNISITFISHAFILIESEEFRFAMDPWAIGPAFVGGWWLATQPIKSWKEKLNECDFIYISHNHPDHLNRHTLKFVRKDMTFIIPNFTSKSVEKILIKIGFKNIVKMDFQKFYKYKDTELFLTILKSGDFRDDSGIYFTYGDFSLFSAVDANNINFNEFPDKVTLFLSSFAGGASGYPLCHDHHSEQEKFSIIERNKKSIFAIVRKNVRSMNAKYFMPYAGFFKELAVRDEYIKTNNKKNSVVDYEKGLKNQSVLNVLLNNKFNFVGEKLISTEKLETTLESKNPEEWISLNIKCEASTDLKIIEYFKKSNFKKDLTLFLLLTDDNFLNVRKKFTINFKDSIPLVIKNNEIEFEDYKEDNNNLLLIKVREHSFYYLINKRLPWENLSIGFQCRLDRKPDVYNSEFWYHFTNLYF